MSLKKKKNGFKETYPIWDQVESWLLFLIYKSCPVAYKHRDPTQSVHVIDYYLQKHQQIVWEATHTQNQKTKKTKTKNKQKKRKEKEEKKAVTKNWPDRDSNPETQN